MNNVTKLRRILKEGMTEDIWVADFEDMINPLYKSIFKDISYDTHNVCIRLGQYMEKIVPHISEIEHTESEVPKYIAGHGVSKAEADEYMARKYTKEQINNKKSCSILTRINEIQLKNLLSEEVDKLSQKKRKDRVRLTQKSVLKISQKALEKVSFTDSIREVHIDFCLFYEKRWNLMELKMSGDTDMGKTISILKTDMLQPYVCLGNNPKRLYFVVMFNNKKLKKNGEVNIGISGYLDPEMILVDKVFFNTILPHDVSYDQFLKIVEKVSLDSRKLHESKISIVSNNRSKTVSVICRKTKKSYVAKRRTK